MTTRIADGLGRVPERSYKLFNFINYSTSILIKNVKRIYLYE